MRSGAHPVDHDATGTCKPNPRSIEWVRDAHKGVDLTLFRSVVAVQLLRLCPISRAVSLDVPVLPVFAPRDEQFGLLIALVVEADTRFESQIREKLVFDGELARIRTDRIVVRYEYPVANVLPNLHTGYTRARGHFQLQHIQVQLLPDTFFELIGGEPDNKTGRLLSEYALLAG